MKKIGILFQIANFSVWKKMKEIIKEFDKNIILMLHFNKEMISIKDRKYIKTRTRNTCSSCKRCDG